MGRETKKPCRSCSLAMQGHGSMGARGVLAATKICQWVPDIQPEKKLVLRDPLGQYLYEVKLNFTFFSEKGHRPKNMKCPKFFLS